MAAKKVAIDTRLNTRLTELKFRLYAPYDGLFDRLTYLAGDVDRYLQQLDGGGDKKDVERELSNMRNRLLDLKGLLR
jgi:hypothetical protein